MDWLEFGKLFARNLSFLFAIGAFVGLVGLVTSLVPPVVIFLAIPVAVCAILAAIEVLDI